MWSPAAPVCAVAAAREVESLSPHCPLCISRQHLSPRAGSLVPPGTLACEFNLLSLASGTPQSPCLLPRAFRRANLDLLAAQSLSPRNQFLHDD